MTDLTTYEGLQAALPELAQEAEVHEVHMQHGIAEIYRAAIASAEREAKLRRTLNSVINHAKVRDIVTCEKLAEEALNDQ